MQQDTQEQQRRAARIETLIQEVAAFPEPRARTTTQELIQALLDMYGEGLARILEFTAQAKTAGLPLIEALARDDLVGSLFLLHGLHPLDIETRITRALVELQAYLKANNAHAELVRVEDGIAYLRLEGSKQGCSASTSALKATLEEAIYKAAPDLDGLQVEETTNPATRPGKAVIFVPPRKHKDSMRVKQPGGV